jgi:NAD-dependent SIR2 family protein deacetylase
MTAALYRRCAVLIRSADGLVIATGAGMGIGSGLPDFWSR